MQPFPGYHYPQNSTFPVNALPPNHARSGCAKFSIASFAMIGTLIVAFAAIALAATFYPKSAIGLLVVGPEYVLPGATFGGGVLCLGIALTIFLCSRKKPAPQPVFVPGIQGAQYPTPPPGLPPPPLQSRYSDYTQYQQQQPQPPPDQPPTNYRNLKQGPYSDYLNYQQ